MVTMDTMNGGNNQSKETAFRAFSLLEDYSALTERWTVHRQQALLASNRTQAYAMVSDPAVKNCAHCAGVKLYCQYRGFGCTKVDFFASGQSNAYYRMVLEVAMHDTKVGYLVAGMWNQAQGILERAADFLQKAKGIALADVLLGDLQVGCGRWGEAFTAYNRASRLTTRAGSGPVIALQSVAYCYKMGYGCPINAAEGGHLEAEATRRGYWKIIQHYYDGLVQRGNGIASCGMSHTIASGDRSHPAPNVFVRPVGAVTVEPTPPFEWPYQLRGQTALTYIVSGAHKGKDGHIRKYGFGLARLSAETSKRDMVYEIKLTAGPAVVVWAKDTTIEKPGGSPATLSLVQSPPTRLANNVVQENAQKDVAGTPSQQQTLTQGVGGCLPR